MKEETLRLEDGLRISQENLRFEVWKGPARRMFSGKRAAIAAGIEASGLESSLGDE